MAGNHTWVRQLDGVRLPNPNVPRRATGIFTNSQENIARFGPEPGLERAVVTAKAVGGRDPLDVPAQIEEHLESKASRALAMQLAFQRGLST